MVPEFVPAPAPVFLVPVSPSPIISGAVRLLMRWSQCATVEAYAYAKGDVAVLTCLSDLASPHRIDCVVTAAAAMCVA